MIEHAVSDRQAATRQQPSPSTVALPVSAADAWIGMLSSKHRRLVHQAQFTRA